MKTLPLILLFAVLAAVLFATSERDEQAIVESGDLVAEFAVGKHGRPLIVPIQLGDQVVQFLVDTGAARTAFDESLRPYLGRSTGTTPCYTSAGPVTLESFRCPPASLGGLDLRIVETVMCCDLRPLHLAGIGEIKGVLGLDFLRNYAVDVDFDAGRLRLWRSAPADWKDAEEKIGLTFRDGCAFLDVDVASTQDAFVLDTGANVCYVRESLYDTKASAGELIGCSQGHGMTIAGHVSTSIGYVHNLSIGSLSREWVRLDRDALNGLGLSYLSRFRLRCDFPNGFVYLDRGERFSNAEPMATSGMTILNVDGRMVVTGVEECSAADVVGILVGDAIVRIDGRLASVMDLHQLRTLFTSNPGRVVEIEVERDGTLIAMRMILQGRPVRLAYER